MKIYIVGGMGSGKSTLAGILGDALGIPVYDLDAVAAADGRKATEDERRRRTAAIAEQEGWIAEGIYLWWTQPLADTADVVVWLDLPRSIALRRIVTRHLRASLAGDNPQKGLRRLARFLVSSNRYYTAVTSPPADVTDDASINRSHAVTFCAETGSRLTVCRSPADVRSLVERLTSRREK